jgi:hypothetical protein
MSAQLHVRSASVELAHNAVSCVRQLLVVMMSATSSPMARLASDRRVDPGGVNQRRHPRIAANQKVRELLACG